MKKSTAQTRKIVSTNTRNLSNKINKQKKKSQKFSNFEYLSKLESEDRYLTYKNLGYV